MASPDIKFIVQRYGNEIGGGAERECQYLAEHLSGNFRVEVITTCAVDYLTWRNVYKPGITEVNGVRVRRFCVDHSRKVWIFNLYSRFIVGGVNEYKSRISLKSQIRWMKMQGPYSKDMLRYILYTKDRTDLFVCFTYLYATTYFAMKYVSDKSLLVPTAHDEPPIYLPLFNEIFRNARGIIYNTVEEKEFLVSVFPYIDKKPSVIGCQGVNIFDKQDIDVCGFLSKYGISLPYVLYVGRVDSAKGCDELFEFFERFNRGRERKLNLVLVGRTSMRIPRNAHLVHLGFLSEEEKLSALSGALALVIPSRTESLSLVLLEALSVGIPVIVNSLSPVLKAQCKKSKGGFSYSNYEEFKVALNTILEMKPEHMRALRENGKSFVRDNYSWELVKERIVRYIEQMLEEVKRAN